MGGLGGTFLGSLRAPGGVAIDSSTGGTQIINSGSISGGANWDGSYATAISFAGDDNELELRAGSNIHGDVVAPGAGDQLTLGGSSDSTFDLGSLGVQYQGFESLAKSGTSAWTVTGTSTSVVPFSISQGTLVLQDAGIGGTIDVSAGAALAGKGSVQGNTSISGLLSPGREDVGMLDFAGDLTLQLGSMVLVDIGGGSEALFDRLGVDGALAYGGSLSLTFSGGFVPNAGDSFQLFENFESYSGSFTNITFSNPDVRGTFDYATGTLNIVAVPEASTIVLISFGLCLLLAVRRRNRRTAA